MLFFKCFIFQTNKTISINPTKKSILEHKLKINSDNYIPINYECLPNGSIESVINTPFDFTRFKEFPYYSKPSDKVTVYYIPECYQ